MKHKVSEPVSFGPDDVDPRTNISRLNHRQIYAHLVSAGPTMHGTPGKRKGKSS